MIDSLKQNNAQATHKDGKDAGIELVRPPAGSKPGDRIYFEGPDFESEHKIMYIGQCTNDFQVQHRSLNSILKRRFLRRSSQVCLFTA